MTYDEGNVVGFWRESVKWWIGPGAEVWENFNVPEANLTLDPPGLRYKMARTWPVTFRDADSLRAFMTLLRDFVDDEGRYPSPTSDSAGPYVPSAGTVAVQIEGKSYLTADEVLEQPERTMGLVQIIAQGSRYRSFDVTLSNRPQTHYAFPGKRPHVAISAHEPQRFPVEDIRVNRIAIALADHTRPLTLIERLRHVPVITKRTESEYYADARARRVRLQSWGLGIVGGLVAALVTRWFGIS